jgi:hypothetical protein
MDLPNAAAALDPLLGELIFRPFQEGEHRTESVGSCSYRSLFDGPIDRGFLEGSQNYLCGIRRDVKKAPAGLVQAQTARDVADYMQTCGGKPSKIHIKEIKAEVRDSLNQAAQPKPSHSTLLADIGRGMALLDGSTAAHSPFIGKLALRQFYEEYDDVLEWFTWAGSNPDSQVATIWPEREATWKRDKEAITLKHGFNVNGSLLAGASLGMKMCRGRFSLVVGDLSCKLTLDLDGLKVSALEFPEEVLALSGDLESRTAARCEFIMGVESALAALVADYLERLQEGILPAEFLACLGEVEAAVA